MRASLCKKIGNGAKGLGSEELPPLYFAWDPISYNSYAFVNPNLADQNGSMLWCILQLCPCFHHDSKVLSQNLAAGGLWYDIQEFHATFDPFEVGLGLLNRP